MHYPFWHVPGLTAPMLIAFIAVFHIFVALYAVGGGLFLAVETRFAYQKGRKDYLEYLHLHTRFFILLTVVYGAITGVGIWWTIGLASPLPTEFLIHVFVFGWAMEYVFFILEIISAFIFYYAWGKLKPDIHQKIAWIYAVSAWMSLVIITGITAFMLNPGDWRNDFWRAWANPQTVPQIFARTGASLLLATLYVYLHASFRVGASSLREVIARRSAKAAMLGALLITAGGAGWYVALPESAKAALTGAAALTILTALIFVLTIVVFFMFYFGPYRNPGWLSPGFAILFFIIGLIVTGAAEFVREAVRKPYVIYGEVYSHNVYPTEIPGLQRDGFLEGGVWTKYFVRQNFSSLIAEDATIDENRIPQLPLSEQRKLGYAVYLYHCGACHDTVGHSGLQELLRGWQPEMIDQLIVKLDRFHFFMPPWSGTAPEAGALRAYLETLLQPHPILESSYKEKETAHVP